MDLGGSSGNTLLYAGIGAGVLVFLSIIAYLIIREYMKTPVQRTLNSM